MRWSAGGVRAWSLDVSRQGAAWGVQGGTSMNRDLRVDGVRSSRGSAAVGDRLAGWKRFHQKMRENPGSCGGPWGRAHHGAFRYRDCPQRKGRTKRPTVSGPSKATKGTSFEFAVRRMASRSLAAEEATRCATRIGSQIIEGGIVLMCFPHASSYFTARDRRRSVSQKYLLRYCAGGGSGVTLMLW